MTSNFLCHIYQSYICVYKAARATTHTNIHSISADTSVSVYITENMEMDVYNSAVKKEGKCKKFKIPSLFPHHAFCNFSFSGIPVYFRSLTDTNVKLVYFVLAEEQTLTKLTELNVPFKSFHALYNTKICQG